MNQFREKNFKGDTLSHKDDSIYKYIKLKYLLSMLDNSKMRVDKTSSWDDVYENFIYKHLFKLNDNRLVSSDNLIQYVYGMSWTYLEESDAMWRIYSNKTDILESAIRVKTSIGRLFNVIYPDVPEDREEMATTFIGFVEYYNDADLKNWIKQRSPINFSNINKIISDSFFIKRNPFDHEKELRIIINKASENSGSCQKYLEFDIVPKTLFDEFVIDPRLNEGDCNQVKELLLSKNIPNDRIRQSDLYKFKPDIIDFDL